MTICNDTDKLIACIQQDLINLDWIEPRKLVEAMDTCFANNDKQTLGKIFFAMVSGGKKDRRRMALTWLELLCNKAECCEMQLPPDVLEAIEGLDGFRDVAELLKKEEYQGAGVALFYAIYGKGQSGK